MLKKVLSLFTFLSLFVSYLYADETKAYRHCVFEFDIPVVTDKGIGYVHKGYEIVSHLPLTTVELNNLTSDVGQKISDMGVEELRITCEAVTKEQAEAMKESK